MASLHYGRLNVKLDKGQIDRQDLLTLQKINHLECRLYDDALNDLLKAMRGAGRKFDSALAELSKATAMAAAAGDGVAVIHLSAPQ